MLFWVMKLEKWFPAPGLAQPAAIESYMSHAAALGKGFRLINAGRSRSGTPILAVGAGRFWSSPVLMVGGTHGTEWASVFCLLRLLSDLVSNEPQRCVVSGIDMPKVLMRRGAVLLPLLNPDGYEIARTHGDTPILSGKFWGLGPKILSRWQANSAGVDINRNFPAKFWQAKREIAKLGYQRPGPTRYGGAFPLSEPESRSAAALIGKLRPCRLYTLHSQGREIYHAYRGLEPPESAEIGKTLAALSGYRLCSPAPEASAAGLRDWFIEKYRRPGFTVELGLGQNPLPTADMEPIYQGFRRALAAALVL